jgi:serine/threonine protein kinase
MTDSHEPAGFIAPDPADLAPLFPAYQIQRLIATGGMGAVYCALQKSLDRTVALKILPMEFSKDAAFCKGFETEAKAMARLNHPNLIGVYDFGEVNGMLYIVMEFVPGQSIYHSANGHALDPAEVIRLISGICNGFFSISTPSPRSAISDSPAPSSGKSKWARKFSARPITPLPRWSIPRTRWTTAPTFFRSA